MAIHMVTGFDVAWSTFRKDSARDVNYCEKCGAGYKGELCARCNVAKGGGLHANDPQRQPWHKSAGVKASTPHTKDFQAVDRRNLAPGQRPPHYSNLNQGGHLSGPAMSNRDWDFHEGYGSADQRGVPGPDDPDYDWEMAQAGQGDFDWPRRMRADKPYDDEDEEQVYGKYLAEQRQKERQGVMDEGIPDPRETGQGREPLPQGYEYGNEGRIRRVPPEIPTDPFRKAWDSLTR